MNKSLKIVLLENDLDSAFTIEEISSLSLDEALMLKPENFRVWLLLNESQYKEVLKRLRNEK